MILGLLCLITATVFAGAALYINVKAEFRCLVPATSFWTDSRPKVPHWFALDEQRTPFAFAGIWRPWTGERKGEVGEHRLFAFLTTESNDLVRPIHAKAMPVVLPNPAMPDRTARKHKQAQSQSHP